MSFAVCRFVLRLSVVAALLLAESFALAQTETTIDLAPQVGPNDLAEVTLEMEVGGTMRVPKDRGNSPEINDLPMSVVAKLVYDEHRLAPTDGPRANRAVRWYKDATATIKVDADGKQPTLSDDRRLVTVDNPGARLVIASPAGLLEREELDLLDAVGDSLAVDGLLPTEPVANGGTWNADPAVMASLLSLDNVAACEVQSVLDKFNADYALVRIAGTVVGSVDGAATEMELRGVYLVNRELHRVTKCNLAVKEIRSVGGATPGLDSVAKLRLSVRPLAESPHLTEDILAALRTPGKARTDLLELDAANQGFHAIHDRRWFVTSRDRETTTLRRVDGADVVGHATITKLPQKSLGRQTTLAEFEHDIRQSLGNNFGELVLSRQWVNAYRHHCLEVVVRGTMEEVPVEWHYYLVAPEAGPRVSVSVTIEGAMASRVANADRNLVNGIQLVAANNTPSGPGASQPAAAAQLQPAQSRPVQFRTTQPAAGPAAAPLVPPSAAAAPPTQPAAQVQPPVRRTIEWSARAQNLDRSMIVPGR